MIKNQRDGQQLRRALSTLPEDRSSVPNIHIQPFTAVKNSSSRESDSLWKHQHTLMHTYTTQTPHTQARTPDTGPYAIYTLTHMHRYGHTHTHHRNTSIQTHTYHTQCIRKREKCVCTLHFDTYCQNTSQRACLFPLQRVGFESLSPLCSPALLHLFPIHCQSFSSLLLLSTNFFTGSVVSNSSLS